MKLFDIILLIPLAWFTIKGFRKGLIIELASVVALIGGIYVAYFFSDVTANFLLNTFKLSSKYIQAVSFIITFIIVIVLVFMLAKALEAIVKTVSLGLLNKMAGAVFGFFKISIIIGFFLFQLTYLDYQKKIISEETKQESFLYEPLIKITLTAMPLMKNIKEKVLACIKTEGDEDECE